MSNNENSIRRDLRHQSVQAWGTAFVLSARFKKWSAIRRLMTLSGILVPVIIGLLYISFTTMLQEKNWVATAATAFLIIHGIGSVVVVFLVGEDKAFMLYESAARNRKNAIKSDRLLKYAAIEPLVFQAEAQTLINEYKQHEENDENQFSISQRERQKGARAGLFRFNWKCKDCQRVPKKEKRLWARNPCENCGEPLNGINQSKSCASRDQSPGA
jgi:mobilome CxxCx(11)CxxC protein